MNSDRISLIEQRLRERLGPEEVQVFDDSAAHAGHPGAAFGGGHFEVLIVSQAFAGKSLLERHRLVYEALADLMKKEIHALSIRALTPDDLV
jgi:BolA protein